MAHHRAIGASSTAVIIFQQCEYGMSVALCQEEQDLHALDLLKRLVGRR